MISYRYKQITKAVNKEFWNSSSEEANSRYVGSYGRGTAITDSDLDVLINLPNSEFHRFSLMNGNGQSQLLQAVKSAIGTRYATTDLSGDGQVVVVKFSDEMKFEILPAFKQDDGSYLYPNTHMGGNWLTTNPIKEQDYMVLKNSYDESNGLLFDTCKHIRYLHMEFFGSVQKVVDDLNQHR